MNGEVANEKVYLLACLQAAEEKLARVKNNPAERKRMGAVIRHIQQRLAYVNDAIQVVRAMTDPVAQRKEQNGSNVSVPGSNPGGVAK